MASQNRVRNQGSSGLPGVVAGQSDEPAEVGVDLLAGLGSLCEQRRGRLSIETAGQCQCIDLPDLRSRGVFRAMVTPWPFGNSTRPIFAYPARSEGVTG